MAPDRSPNRPPWAPLVAAVVLVPTVLAGLTLAWPRPQVESALGDQARAALTAAGIAGGTVAFSGRDAMISGVPAAQRMLAIQAVEAGTGVRVARFSEPGSGGTGGPAPAVGISGAQQGTFGLARRGGALVLSGAVGSPEIKDALVRSVTAAAGGRQVVDQLTVNAGATPPPGIAESSAGALAAALAAAGSDLAVTADPGIALTGTVPDEAARTAALQAVRGALPGATVDDRLTVAGPAPGGGDLDPAAKKALQDAVTALQQGAPITFDPDVPTLTGAGRGTVAKVLAAVKAVPDARLEIDGYVARGPGNGKLTAQQLSDQRAAAVRDALVAGGVPADHLTVRGRGDSDLGRRAQVTVV